MIKVLFVCLGNICRSPLAEGVFSSLINKEGLSNKISCNSAGTAGYHIGEAPDHRTIKIAAKHSIVLHHVGQKLSTSDFSEYDYILAMDKSNYENIKYLEARAKYRKAEIYLFRSFDIIGKNEDVPDPYYGNMDDFENVYNISARCSTYFLQYLREKHNI